MSVMSSGRRQKSWQIAGKLGSLLDALEESESELGVRLRAWARSAGVNSDEDAARLIGVSYRQYQRWLSGDSAPRTSSLKLVAAAYERPLAELVGEPARPQLDRIEDKVEQILALLSADEQAVAEVEALPERVASDAQPSARASGRSASRPAAARRKPA